MTTPAKTVSLSLIILLVFSAPSHAYLDPGTGSVLLQLILGGLAGLAVVGKLFWHRVLEILGIRKADAPGTEGDTRK